MDGNGGPRPAKLKLFKKTFWASIIEAFLAGVAEGRAAQGRNR